MWRIFLLFVCISLVSCHKDEFKKHNYNLVGKWKRIETFISPGNGGSWQPDTSNPPTTIEFTAEGKFISNSSYYSNFTGYKVNADNSIEFYPRLTNVPSAVYYSFNSDTELTLTFACIEGCGDRFVKY